MLIANVKCIRYPADILILSALSKKDTLSIIKVNSSINKCFYLELKFMLYII